MRVLVTGATGYVGLNLVHRLAEGDHEPVALVRESSPTHLLPDSVETARGDVTRPDSLTNALAGVDAVVHLAAIRGTNDTSAEGKANIDYEQAERVNVAGTRNLLEAADESGVETIVHTSTIYAHPDISPPGSVTSGASVYADTKQQADEVFLDSSWSFEYTLVFPTYIVGPRDYRMKRFEPFYVTASNVVMVPPLYMPGELNLIHMDDVTASIEAYLSDPTNGREVLSNENVTSRRYISEIASVCEGRQVTVPFPFYERLVPVVAAPFYRLGLLPVSGDRLAELTRSLGVVPDQYACRAPVDLHSTRQAVEDTYDWYVSVGLL
jgi:nucleoside-diphosphate-sugar epimerase